MVGIIEKEIANFPLRIILFFLITSELLIWLGPIKYSIDNNFSLLFYLTIVNLAFYLGYKNALKKFRPSYFSISFTWIKLILILGLLISIYQLFSLWDTRGISYSSFFSSLLFAIQNPGAAYYSEPSNEAELSIFRILLSPISWASIPIGIFYWSRLKIFGRLIIIAIFFVNLVSWLGIGVRKGIFDLIIVFMFSLVATYPKYIQKKKLILRYFAISGSIFILFFIYSNLSRAGLADFTSLSFLASNNYREFYLNNLSLPITVGLGFITSYLCQGYFALSISLKIGIIPIAPLGMSWFTIAIAKKINYDPTPGTYNYILEKLYGIDMTNNWHSIYVWLANDFSFLGVPIIIYFIGYFLGLTWCDSVYGKNFLSFPIMTLFVIMSLYFFANNQVLSFSFVPFITSFIFYLASRHFKISSNNALGKLKTS